MVGASPGMASPLDVVCGRVRQLLCGAVRVKPPSRTAAGGVPAAAALVVCAVTSLQFGAGVAATLFDDLGAGGAAFLRLAVAAVVLLAAWRPRLRARPAAALRLAALFGATRG